MVYQSFSRERPYRLLFTLLALLLLGGCEQTTTRDSTAHKPSNPLQLSIQALDIVTPGTTARFAAQLSSLHSFNNVHLEVTLPEALTLQAGSLQWQGALATGQTQQLDFSINIPSDGVYRITAKAIVKDASNGISREAAYIVGDPGQEPSSGVSTTPRVAPTTSDGRPVEEYKIR